MEENSWSKLEKEKKAEKNKESPFSQLHMWHLYINIIEIFNKTYIVNKDKRQIC